MSEPHLEIDEKLRVKDLVVRFHTYEGIVKAVERASLQLRRGETLGIVGETGSGKSVTGLTILALTPPPGRVEEGSIFLRKSNGNIVNILNLNELELLKIRGKEISMIFQEPNAALDPIYKVGDQVSEAILSHRLQEMVKKAIDILESEMDNANRSLFSKLELWNYHKMLENRRNVILKLLNMIPVVRRRIKSKLNEVVKNEVIELLRIMGIPDPNRIINAYPHELSGGMQQRVVIAIALACSPALLIADEPTTNLDVTVQAQILDLINKLKEKFGSSIIYITHDMGVVAEMCSRVAVMYAGSIVEVAPVKEIFKTPLHPYTKALLESIPRPKAPLKSIPGTVPNLVNPPSGCRFHPRCPYVMDKCKLNAPELFKISEEHYVACFLYGG
ncbi:MAG: ABC transporter ATP-binding protein [Nitrososphaerota archaeon]